MKVKNMLSLILACVFTFAFISSCGGGTESGITGGGSVSISQQANSSASIALQSISMITGTSNFTNVLGGVSGLVGRRVSAPSQYEPMEKASRMLAKMSVLQTNQGGTLCPNGGSASMSPDRTIITYAQCRNDDLQMDGIMILSRMPDGSLRITFQNFSMIEFNGGVLVSRLDMLSLVVTYTFSGQGTIVLYNGDLRMNNYLSNKVYTMRFTNYRETYSSISGTSAVVRVDGTLRGEEGSEYIEMTYHGYTLRITTSASLTNMTADGRYTISTNKQGCFAGDYTIATLQEITMSNDRDRIIGGRIRINNNVYVTWQSNGSVVLWFDSNNNGREDAGETASYNDYYQLARVCEIPTFNEEIPLASSDGSQQPIRANNMTITLTWTGGSTSDMDLHLNYYNTTNPTSTTPITWWVDWHGRDSCSNGRAGINLDNDARRVCEIVLDYDDVDGYGPEHITATVLPAGYYVVSVNSFDLDRDPRAVISVTIQIGDRVFGPYTHTFTTYDGEGCNPNAWFAVADIVVHQNGTVEVRPHNPSLPLWHRQCTLRSSSQYLIETLKKSK